MGTSQRTAGIIIVGDEILNGSVVDTNSNFLTRKMRSLGVDVRKISVLSDSIEDIAEEIAHFSKKYNYVITSGGIGPTHDDITYQGVAKGLNEPLTLLPGLVELIKNHFKVTVDDFDESNPPTFPFDVDTSSFNPALKMALVPACSQLHFSPAISRFPMVQAKNVFIFPGIPQYLRRGSDHLDSLCRNPDRQYYSRYIYLSKDEVSLAPVLNSAVKQFKDQVIFGSYPVVDHNYFTTQVTMESANQSSVDQAHQYLTSQIPSSDVIDYDPDAIAHATQSIQDIINDSAKSNQLHLPVSSSFQVIEECLSRYGPHEVCVSFNGGKDCSAMLHVIYAAWKKAHPADGLRLRAVYIRSQDPFPEMERFVEETQKRYDLELWTVPGPIREGLTSLLQQHPDIKAILMGTRRSDPHAANLQAFQMTDQGWPSVMRVSPILDWSYQQVWTFLRQLSLPYCTLYDRGYTSVGNRNNTKPNPALRLVDADGKEVYRPAYFLHDCLSERQGRL